MNLTKIMDGVDVREVLPVHEDERRTLSAMFNGDFTAEQIKIIDIKKDSTLGNHYHNYRETFYVLDGKAFYTVENIETKERKELTLSKGQRMTIQPRIAHKALLKAGTIMIEGTARKYISAEENDVGYQID
jgi:quercetin dioxygenase-like cupin family protein